MKPLCPILNNRFPTLGRVGMWEGGGGFNSTIDIIQRFGISIYVLCAVNLVTFDHVCFSLRRCNAHLKTLLFVTISAIYINHNEV